MSPPNLARTFNVPIGVGDRLPATDLSLTLAHTAKYMSDCPKSQSYEYVVDTCPPTCRALSEADTTCSVSFVPVDGCTCPENTFLNDAGTCVPAQECPCYLHGTTVANGEVVQEDNTVW